MTDSENKCPERWDPEQLLAYMEGELEPPVSRELEDHLRTCGLCAAEVESLRHMHALLGTHVEAFHPEAEDLYRFVSGGTDLGGAIVAHLQMCQVCQEEVQLLRDMIEYRDVKPQGVTSMPAALRHRLERDRPTTGSDRIIQRVRAALAEFFTFRQRIPVLAFGSAVTIVIVAAISIPLWQFIRETGVPELKPAAQDMSLKQRFDKLDQAEVLRDARSEREGAPAILPQKKAEPQQAPAAPAPAPETITGSLGKGHETDAAVEKRRAGRLKEEAASVEQDPRTNAQKGGATAPVEAKLSRTVPSSAVMPLQEPAPVNRPVPEAQARAKLSEHGAGAVGKPARAVYPKMSYHKAKVDAALSEIIRVTVRVVDAEGREVPWLKIAKSAELGDRYRLEPAKDVTPAATPEKPVSPKSQALESQDKKAGELEIVVRVQTMETGYELEARLLEGTPRREIRSETAFAENQEQAQERVNLMVRELLEKGDGTPGNP